MLRSALLSPILAGLLLLPGLAVAASAPPDRCATPADLVAAPAPLPHLAEAMKARKLSVLVVGSATVFGPEAALQPGTVTNASMFPGRTTAVTNNTPTPPASETSFPLQMAKAMRGAVSGLTVDVSIVGGRGITATDMLGLMRQELTNKRYQLVIWQTGTVEAVKNTPAGDFFQTLSAGATLAQEAGADLVLVDQQYSRFLHANANLDPYVQTMQQIAAMPGNLLFRRLEIMRAWVNEGQIDLERAPKGERRATVELLHACLGQQLARLLMDAARS